MIIFLTTLITILNCNADIKLQAISGVDNVYSKNGELNLDVSSATKEISFSFLSTDTMGRPNIVFINKSTGVSSSVTVIYKDTHTTTVNQMTKINLLTEDVCIAATGTGCLVGLNNLGNKFQIGIDVNADGDLNDSEDDAADLTININ